MKKIITIAAIVIIIFFTLALVFDWGVKNSIPRNENIIATSTPQMNVSSTTSEMPIVVYNIKDNQTISNPITITGKARGNWYFEASFPVKLVDANGNVLAETAARAESDWMTTDFVNFTATLSYTKSTSTNRALIVLKNDNPSGNPEFDKSIFIPVILK